MTAYRPAHDSADTVWKALDLAGSSGLTLVELVAVTGLTRNQVKRGIWHANQVLQVAEMQPISVIIPGYRYILPDEWADADDWRMNRMKDTFTRLQTQRNGVEAILAKWPKRVRSHVLRDFDRLIEDTADLLEVS